MHIPQFWAEGRARHRGPGGQRTVRRFGWSDVSPADAQAMADRRAAEALQRLLAGEALPRREPKVPYNGADGLPIREQVLARHGDTVLTRNSYGAVCLNTPDVLFTDMDAGDGYTTAVGCALGCALVLVPLAAAVWFWSWPIAVLAVLGLAVAAYLVDVLHRRGDVRRRERWAEAAAQKVAAFAAERPGWHLRVYRTPAGLRVLALHQRFDPVGDEAAECFRALGADPQYVKMCRLQRCFRARVSPKPWRVGMEDRYRPQPGVWPVKPEWLPVRAEWLARYEAASAGYAACRFVGEYGDGPVDPRCEAVRRLHDELCRVESGLPIA